MVEKTKEPFTQPKEKPKSPRPPASQRSSLALGDKSADKRAKALQHRYGAAPSSGPSSPTRSPQRKSEVQKASDKAKQHAFKNTKN